MIIREASENDLGTIGTIWNHYIQATSYNWRHKAYTPAQLYQWFQKHGTEDRPVLVVEENGRVVGFGALSAFRNSEGYRYTAEDTIYVTPEAMGRGIGTRLMEELLKKGKEGGLLHVVAMVDSANTLSIEFHTKMGFVTVGVLKDIGEKDGKTLSCVIMQRKL